MIQVLRCWRVAVVVFGAAGSVVCAREKPDPVMWYRATTPELTIVAALDQKQTIARANEFSQYVAALREYFGASDAALPPLTMVVFPNHESFCRYRPMGKDGKARKIGGYFVRHETSAAIGVPAGAGPEVRRTVFHEGVHWYLHATGQWMPPWLDEGMAEVFSTFEVKDRTARWGREVHSHTEFLHQGRERLMPVRKLLLTSRDDLLTASEADTKLFYAQAWAFVHFLIFGQTEIPRATLQHYSDLVARGMDADDAFVKAFGQSYADMDKRLLTYLDGGKYFLRRRPLANVPSVRVTIATELEVDEALGRLALGAGHPDLAIEHGRAMVRWAAADPRGHTLLGLALKAKGEDAAAAAEFELATTCDAADFQPYFELACMIQNAASAGGGTLSGEDARRAADLYKKALRFHPALESSYANLGGVVGLVEPLTADDQEVMAEGARRFPSNLLIRLGVAQIARRNGDIDRARTLLAEVMTQLPSLAGNVASYARRIEHAWDNQDFLAGINAVMGQGNYAEALAMLDRRMQDGGDLSFQVQMVPLRRDVQTAVWVQQLNAALDGERWDDARETIHLILEAESPAAAKNEAKRILRELEEQEAKR